MEVISYAEDAELEKIYVIGGAEIYKEALPYLSEFLWTKLSEENHRNWKLRRLVKIPKMPY